MGDVCGPVKRKFAACCASVIIATGGTVKQYTAILHTCCRTLMRDLWHFHFYGKTPLALVHGRERIYFEHFWNDFAADRTRSVPEADRRLYAAAYAEPGGMRAGFEIFHAFEQDAADFAKFAEKKLPMPMLVLTGEKASGEFLIEQGRLVADNVEGVIVKGSGHWLMDEARDQVVPKLVSFLGR